MRKSSAGKWVARARLRDERGVLRDMTAWGSTKAKAVGRLRERLAKYREPGRIPLFRDVAETWFTKWGRGVAETTRKKTRRILDLHILPAVGELYCNEIRVSTLEELVRSVEEGKREGKGGGQAVAAQVRTILIAVLNEAVRMDYILANAAERTTPVRVKTPEVRTLTAEQIREVRARVQKYAQNSSSVTAIYLADIVDFMLGTGARSGEALGLRWDDMDLNTGRCLIAGMAVQEKGRVRYERRTKTGSSRAMYMPAWLVSILQERKKNSTGKFVFTNADGSLIRATTLIWALKTALGEEYSWVTPRVFRKTVATLVSRGLGDDVASVQLGHESARMTRMHYIERRGEADARAVLDKLV